MPTEVQEALGAAAYRMILHNPHIIYGTQFDRFAWTVPPDPIHADCSGACSHVYWDGPRIKIGADTGAIARDVAAGKASWVNMHDVRSGDLVMRRSGREYNGGSDEHVGMLMYRLSDGRPVTFESAGSKNGVGTYPRASNFWRDGVRYHDLGTPQVPVELPVPEDEKMYFLIKGDKRDETFLTDGFVTKRRTFDAAEEANLRKSGVLKQQDTVHWPQAFVDRIPTVELA